MTTVPSRALHPGSDPKQQLAVAIGELKPRTQLVLALYYQEGCTQAEIGEILGVTVHRVCRILCAATKRLCSTTR